MKWPFTITDNYSPYHLLFLKSLDALTTWMFSSKNIREGNPLARALFVDIGFVSTFLLFGVVVYFYTKLLIFVYEWVDYPLLKTVIEGGYNCTVFVYILIPLYNFYCLILLGVCK